MTELVVLGGSAGAIQALGELLAQLPPDYEAATLVVVHVPPNHPSRLPEVLARQTGLDVAHARDGERITPGTVRIAPPDRHLVVSDGVMRLSRGPRENRHRPSIDVLFRSAATWYGAGLTAGLLSGGPGDGIAGLSLVREAGGLTLIQDPAQALLPPLPERALEEVGADHVASAAELGRLLATGQGQRQSGRSESAPTETDGWQPAAFACPDCSGALWQTDDGRILRYRCRVGHAYGPDALMEVKASELEQTLWSAINVMEERAELSERLATRADAKGFDETALDYRATADEMTHQAAQLRELVLGAGGSPPGQGPIDQRRSVLASAARERDIA
ncbi:MAG TPA: chemotaxis protein CheB [Candidatus Limnocylindria bacterium]|nr:chemotaxis protein CheB [Candidatus Limnocylindria bacterium]